MAADVLDVTGGGNSHRLIGTRNQSVRVGWGTTGVDAKSHETLNLHPHKGSGDCDGCHGHTSPKGRGSIGIICVGQNSAQAVPS